ncbi:TPA: inovirus-type Gp2 protein, partial [Vibrio campbellii]|nr:inovirus-type Gp2 protein [Vibrio campbellii]
AWCSALGEQVEGGYRLVEFVNNGRFYLNQRDAGFEEDLEDFIYAISYLAKIKSKNYNENKRSFGYSLL